jgi:hypothetical protein
MLALALAPPAMALTVCEGKVAANKIPPPAARLAVRKPRRDKVVCGEEVSTSEGFVATDFSF